MKLNDTILKFLSNPSNMDMGAKKLSQRWKVSEEEVKESRDRARSILSAASLVEELENADYKGSIKDTAKTIVKNSAENTLDFRIDIVKRQCESKIKEKEQKYQVLLSEYEKINDAYNDYLRLNEYVNLYNIPLIPEHGRQGASIIIYSDWHLGQVVDKNSLNGLNEYNPEIAKKRANLCFSNTVKLINKDSDEFDNHSTVIFLNGDFVNGYIHPDSQKITNSMTPIEEVIYAQELLTNGLTHLQNNLNTDKIICICHNGNHARVEKRMESSVDHRTSYESMLYASLANKFSGEIDFVIPKSDISYTSVMGKTIRAFHGHQCNYGSGIGGLTIPLTKFIMRQDTNKKADFNVLSHYHQLSLPTKNSMLNGSLVGMDNYCQSIGATGEAPIQAYRLLDSRYGFTSFNPIICE